MATHEDGMRAARAVSQWVLGDPYWADVIVGAYLRPDTAMENLRREKGEE